LSFTLSFCVLIRKRDSRYASFAWQSIGKYEKPLHPGAAFELFYCHA
jgi:hypothetical protein